MDEIRREMGTLGGSPSTSMQGLHVQEFFAPPLPFDGELLHSMQDLTSSTEWAFAIGSMLFKSREQNIQH